MLHSHCIWSDSVRQGSYIEQSLEEKRDDTELSDREEICSLLIKHHESDIVKTYLE